MANEVELAQALLELWRTRESALAREVQDEDVRLLRKKSELHRLRSSIKNLTAVAGLEPEEKEIEVLVAVDDLPDPERSADKSESPKRTPTPRIVADIVEAAGRPISRDEIRSEFEQRGLAANYRNPTNVIGTAVMRARQRGWIQEVDGLFQTPTPNGVGTPTLEQV